uniref:Uncharacterized protein n=1 Tax=Pseudictyota dubia TaxID=2749911 RepID=A0A7R9ZFL4_9STRA|mmetsp:Transcript_50691/g.93718  ORF Transcript_50691/g.93718 Transcript_50691/m.93718 type:complete len:476 (+) Transcript_50691:117-1544(+)
MMALVMEGKPQQQHRPSKKPAKVLSMPKQQNALPNMTFAAAEAEAKVSVAANLRRCRLSSEGDDGSEASLDLTELTAETTPPGAAGGGFAAPARGRDNDDDEASLDLGDLAATEEDDRSAASERSDASLDLFDLAAPAPARAGRRRGPSDDDGSDSDDDLLARTALCRSSGSSVESSVELAELCELAELSRSAVGVGVGLSDGDDDSSGDDVLLSTALAGMNSRNGSSWADFSSEEGDQPQEQERKVSVTWANRSFERLNLSLFDLDDAVLKDEQEGQGCADDYADQRRSSVVRFGPISVRDHVALSDMTPSEKRSYWYDERDHASIQMDILRSLNALQGCSKKGRSHNKGKGNDMEEEEEGEACIRGLEHAITDGCWIDTHPKTNAAVVKAVLSEQRKSRIGRGRGGRRNVNGVDENSSSNPEERIAAASRALTQSAQDLAAAVGRNDAAVAGAALGLMGNKKPRRKCRTSAAA